MHAFEMEPRLTVLALLLDALGVGADIETVDDRKRVQKAVYLAQRSGVDLGYRYSWYKRGPYSRALTRDYYELADSIEIGEHTNGDKLRPASLAKLRKLRPLFAAPQETGLAQADWLELVASVDFLRTVTGYDEKQVAATIRDAKPSLFPHLRFAKRALAFFPVP